MLDKPNKLKIKLFFMLKTNFKIYAPQIVMLSQQLVSSLSIFILIKFSNLLFLQW